MIILFLLVYFELLAWQPLFAVKTNISSSISHWLPFWQVNTNNIFLTHLIYSNSLKQSTDDSFLRTHQSLGINRDISFLERPLHFKCTSSCHIGIFHIVNFELLKMLIASTVILLKGFNAANRTLSDRAHRYQHGQGCCWLKSDLFTNKPILGHIHSFPRCNAPPTNFTVNGFSTVSY